MMFYVTQEVHIGFKKQSYIDPHKHFQNYKKIQILNKQSYHSTSSSKISYTC